MAITQAQQDALVELYIAILDRAPDQAGINFWADKLINLDGGDLEATANRMWNSPGAQAEYGPGLTVTQTITKIYDNVLNRAPDAAGLAHWTNVWNNLGPGQTMLNMINNLKTNPSTDPQFLADKQLFLDKVELGKWFAFDLGSNDPALAEEAFRLLEEEGLTVAEAQAQLQLDPAESVILTGGTDVVETGNNGDIIHGTESTLNTSDSLDGGDGQDTLSVSVNTEASFIAAPTLDNIEWITVRQGGAQDLNGSIDLSGADFEDTMTIEVNENAFLDWTWEDIQSVNNTLLRVIDTDGGYINFDYDNNAYAGNDTADLTVAEVDCLDVDFHNSTDGSTWSNIDAVNLHSQNNGQVNITMSNYLWALNVGTSFTTLTIDGEAHLTIEEALNSQVSSNPNVYNTVTTVDASGLEADLDFDIVGQGAATGPLNSTLSTPIAPLTIIGAQGDNDIDVQTGEYNTALLPGVNASVTTFAGDDLIQIGDLAGFNGEDWDAEGGPWAGECFDDPDSLGGPGEDYGDSTISTAAGHDTVEIALHGQQWVSTGDGNDDVAIWGNVEDLYTVAVNDGTSTIDTGAGNDLVEIESDFGDYIIDLGADHDALYIEGSGEDCLDGDVSVEAGAGDDYMDIAVVSSFSTVNAGDGADTLHLGCDCDEDLGELAVTMGAGNDDLFLYGVTSNEGGSSEITVDIDLGAGDDSLVWEGASGSLSLANAVQIDAGAGNDWLTFMGDHRLNLVGGAGADTVEMRANHLESQDTLDMGDGIDRIILHNGDNWDNCDFGVGCDSPADVRLSETSNTTSVEWFDLREGNIELHLTTGLFQTAQDNNITVRTELSERVELPSLTYAAAAPADGVDAFSEGMSRAQWEIIVRDWTLGRYIEDNGYAKSETGLTQYLFDNGIEEIDFHDASVDLDGSEQISSAQEVDNDFTADDSEDQVFFRVPTCDQTVDVSEVDFSTVPGWEFTLLGGNVRDILIATDVFVSGNYNLRFDSEGGDAESVTDTLVLEGSADITDLDEEQISGLECIILEGDGNDEHSWKIDLTEEFVNQTTGSAALEIFVDDDVPASSELILSVDKLGTPANGVVVHTTSNVLVYLDTDGDGDADTGPLTAGFYLGGVLEVVSQLHFTPNADTLIGSSGDDIFYADSLNQIQDADHADGGEGEDELRLAFGVYNESSDLEDQLDDNLDFQDIEILRFVVPGASSKSVGEPIMTPFNIGMQGLEGFLDDDSFLDDLQELHTGTGDDYLDEMEGGIEYHTYSGDDFIDIGDGEEGATVFAGSGADTIFGEDGDDVLYGQDGNDTIWGGEGEDYLSGGSGNDTIDGGEDDDTILGGSGNDILYGEDGADSILGGSGADTIFGEDGNDTIWGGSGADSIFGGSGDDDIYGGAGADSIYGGSGDDYISGGDSNDLIYGGSGADTIHGGSGNDTIYSGDGAALITGGSGNDYIEADDSGDVLNINAGAGNDTVDINWLSSSDTLNGGAGTDTLKIDNEDTLDDSEFTNVTNFNVLNIDDDGVGDDAKTVTGAAEFEESGITTVISGDGDDVLDFSAITSNRDMSISAGAGADSILSGNGDDTVLAGDGADTVFSSTGADDIDLGAGDGDADILVYTESFHGALTGDGDFADIIRNFEAGAGADTVMIAGNLLLAVDDDTSGDLALAANNNAVDASTEELVVDTSQAVTDADLTADGFANLLAHLNNGLDTAGAGDSLLYLVQGQTDTALYFYQENGLAGSENAIDASEIRLLGVFDNSLLEAVNIQPQP